jgi:hypothetical protein
MIGGPVSEALESDVRSWVRKHGVVVWLDGDGHYSSLVDRLVQARASGNLPYEVKAFRGSHLDLMLSLDGLASGTEKTPLLVHVPGFNEDTIRQTPSLELYEAGVRYRKSLDTLVNEAAAGRVRPDHIAAFHVEGQLSLERADRWLAAALAGGDAGIGAQLRAMHPCAIFDDLLGNGFVAQQVLQGHADAVWERLRVATGLTPDWLERSLPPAQPRASDIAFAAASFCLCVEYVDDLRRPPIAEILTGVTKLPRPVIDLCRSVAVHLRERHPAFYKRTADETEALLVEEVEAVKAEDLGRVDTFRFEEDTLLEAALSGLDARVFETPVEWASLRIGSASSVGSYWLREDPTRHSAWQLISDAARLGQAVARAGEHLSAEGSVDAAIDAYMERGAAVDQAHRHLEQRRAALLFPQLPQFDRLRACLDALRVLWREWADAWARDFSSLCRAHGFLPEPGRQQRTLFDEVVKPLTQETGTTAYFLVDAFRFEMAEELYRQLATESSTTVHLKGRLAELPSVTEVGMNVLAPVVNNGRLAPSLTDPDGGKLQGFATGEFRVFDPETRRKAMHRRVGGASCPGLKLEEVVSRDGQSLQREMARARLVVVHSEEIDKAGENGVGPAVFDHVMQKLRAAWRLLRDAGVRRFVFTADHGFLLLDETSGAVQSHGRKIDSKRRHVLSSVAADHSGEVRVALSALGYEGVEGQLMFPESTAVFDTGRRSMSFAHGGNSLQERVIPVLTIVHRSAAGGSALRYTVSASPLDGVAGMHCIEARVELADQHAFDFGGPKEVELELRVRDAEDVSVELCQVRGKARIEGGAVLATVAERFELFFRLSGSEPRRVQIELSHGSQKVEVAPCVPDARFEVAATRRRSSAPPPSTELATGAPASVRAAWLLALPEGGVRQLFEHLATHGAVTEMEASSMLGGPRALRRFAVRFEEFAQKAPFGVRIDVVAGAKRYVREGSSS